MPGKAEPFRTVGGGAAGEQRLLLRGVRDEQKVKEPHGRGGRYFGQSERIAVTSARDFSDRLIIARAKFEGPGARAGFNSQWGRQVSSPASKLERPHPCGYCFSCVVPRARRSRRNSRHSALGSAVTWLVTAHEASGRSRCFCLGESATQTTESATR